MRKTVLSFGLTLLCVPLLFAEPLVLEQADNVVKEKTLEIGINNLAYQYDYTEITDDGGSVVAKLTSTGLTFPVFARYAFTSRLEGVVSVPYLSLSSKSDISGTSSTTNESGLADPVLGIKYNLQESDWKVGVAANVSLPAGQESTKMPTSFRNGLNIKPLLAARKNLGKLITNVNLSYHLTGEYTDANKVKENPADILSIGAGVEYPCPRIKGMELIGEFIYSNLSETKVADISQSGSAGTQMDLALGVRCNRGNWKTKLGLDLSLGEEKYRTYDYKILAGVTYLVQL